jgi:hypothetical protein
LTGKIAVSYKTLLLLEHLLITHGPLRVAEEFQCDKDVIKEMVSFQFVHEKGSVIKQINQCTILWVVASNFYTFLVSLAGSLGDRELENYLREY